MKLKPIGEPVALEDLPSGTLFSFKETIALKSEYNSEKGAVKAVIVGSGEYFWGGAKTVSEQLELMVQPLQIIKE